MLSLFKIFTIRRRYGERRSKSLLLNKRASISFSFFSSPKCSLSFITDLYFLLISSSKSSLVKSKSPLYKAVVIVPTTFGRKVVSILALLSILDTSTAASINSAWEGIVNSIFESFAFSAFIQSCFDGIAVNLFPFDVKSSH